MTSASQIRLIPTPGTANDLAKSGLWDALALLEAHQEEARWIEADALAAELLAEYPTTPVVLVEVARFYARRGRKDDAIELLLREHVGTNVRLFNYRFCKGLFVRHAAGS